MAELLQKGVSNNLNSDIAKTTRINATQNRVFQIVLRGGSGDGGRNFAVGFFLIGGGNLKMSDFDHSNILQS